MLMGVGRIALFLISSAKCMQVTLLYLEFRLSGVFACRVLYLCSFWARSCVQSARGSGGRETPSAGEVTCTICWQSKIICPNYSTFVCEMPSKGIWLEIPYSLWCVLSPIFRCFFDMLLARLYLLPARMNSKSTNVPPKVSLACQSAHRPQKCIERS